MAGYMDVHVADGVDLDVGNTVGDPTRGVNGVADSGDDAASSIRDVVVNPADAS